MAGSVKGVKAPGRSKRELQQIGRELASAMIKGSYSQVPGSEVPLLTLAAICENHEVSVLTFGEFRTVATAMQEALAEAERWNG
jgi:hypothetical protein